MVARRPARERVRLALHNDGMTQTPADGRPAATTTPRVRLTQQASGGGCACKVPPGELERVLGTLVARGG